MGTLAALESSCGVKGVPPPRNGILASELAEVRMGLSWTVVSLGRKPEMELTILPGRQARVAASSEKGSLYSLPTVSGSPWEPRLHFPGHWVSRVPKAGWAHSRASNDSWAWQRGTREP